MIFGQDRTQLRQPFFTAWQKHIQQQPLEPLEQQIIAVILEHPEYHKMFAAPENYLNKDYLPEFGETNPFLHMSLHLGVRDQVSTNRPAGILAIYQQLVQKTGDVHTAEHNIMEQLIEAMLSMQQLPAQMVEENYLEKLKGLL